MADVAYENIVELTDREIQMLLREVDTKDLALAMMDGNEAVNARYFANVSDRVAGMLREAMGLLGSPPQSDIESVQARIVDTLEQLREAKVVTWPRKTQTAPPKRELPQEYQDQKDALEKQLREISFMTLSQAELPPLYQSLAEVARMEGILNMGRLVPINDQDFFCLGIQLIVDGVEPSLVQVLLNTRMYFLMQHYETMYQMMMEAMMSLQCGDNARVIEIKMKLFYVAPEQTRVLNEAVTVAEIESRLKEKPVSRCGVGEVANILTDIAIVARREGLSKLDDLVAFIDDSFLAQGLRLVIDGTLPDLVQDMLETRLVAWKTYFETKCDMAKTGVLSIQAGDNPRIVAQKLRNHFDFI